ncbi:MAG TPA: SDR family NAD(P)-dependent oxidoreductase [Candidatus Sulfotelmatobacter sp.]|jgi:short-subunit dehydrogenase|nr:SDR family NAD(P)-dependent oxidoreductase [Candidatus Sulfotelmatobacter sp.]
MRAALDKKRFGLWALVTGASSGIGEEFARHIAASGIHVALVGRREHLLQTVGEALHYEFKPLGVYVTVLAAGFTNTAVIDKFGLMNALVPASLAPKPEADLLGKGLASKSVVGTARGEA